MFALACSEATPNDTVPASRSASGGNPATSSNASESRTPTSFRIAIDYRFDQKSLFSAERRLPLEAAARHWETLIASDFAPVPPGIPLRSRPPEDMDAPGIEFTLDYPIDDLAILGGFSSLDGPGQRLALSGSSFTPELGNATLLAALDRRYHGNPFQPWIASIGFDDSEDWYFDPTPDTNSDIPSTQSDFMSTALHELGHVLGIGSSAAWDALISGNSFIGAHAMDLVGGPVPLTLDHAHVEKGVMVDQQRALMDPSTPLGARKYPTRLELAILVDLGYKIVTQNDLPEP